jgi:4a-hydroxytetrahydrobiopterin dehydratase
MSRPLTGAARAQALAGLDGWHDVPGRNAIARSIRFDGFAAAFAFMTRVALAAERLNHHPEWSNLYDRVDIVLSTHDAHGVTDRDIALAAAIDAATKGH